MKSNTILILSLATFLIIITIPYLPSFRGHDQQFNIQVMISNPRNNTANSTISEPPPVLTPLPAPQRLSVSLPPPDDQQPVIRTAAPPPPSFRASTSLEKVEAGLARARAAIREAARTGNVRTSENEEAFVPLGPVYRHPQAFHQSHIEMVRTFKIWTYKEGDIPMVHEGPLNNIYGIEGRFIQEMGGEMRSRFRARHPDEAHAFFLPFSVAKMVQFLYRPLVSYSRAPLHRVVLDYVNVVAQRYPYWNRSLGADHFMLSCHDWAPDVSDADPELFRNLIRGLCNANMSEGFHPRRDVSIPEINIPVGKLGPPDLGVRPSKRQTLAFFAGGAHGYVRSVLFEHWKEKDDDVRVYEHLPKKLSYFKMLGESKFCLCPSGYEVASPRIVEAIHADCVPVTLSDNYSLPFSDVLDWSKFSVHVPVARIPEIKVILQGVSANEYMRLLKGVRSVKWHFTLNRPPQPFDMIHMMLHSIWLRRLDFRLPMDSSSS